MAGTPTEITKPDIIALFRELESKAGLREVLQEGKPPLFGRVEDTGLYFMTLAKSAKQPR